MVRHHHHLLISNAPKILQCEQRIAVVHENVLKIKTSKSH